MSGPDGPRTVVVTGASSGIGAAVLRSFRDAGWAVAGLDLVGDPDAGIEQVDVRDVDGVAAAVDRIRSRHGRIDAAVTAAGHYEMVPVSDVTRDQWNRMLHVHLGGALNVIRAVVPEMKARGTGSIVCVTSELAIGGGDGDSHYAAAKGAIIGLIRSSAVELAPFGIRVNGVAPGPTDTPLLPADSPWRDRAYLDTLPARRLARPDEIARTARFLTEEATYCVGEIVSPNSGAVI
jgi:NAD(P)-dependent dehydrogenase (short-subunit alcohol dehydrogenase family)